jgi:hypothetical protein
MLHFNCEGPEDLAKDGLDQGGEASRSQTALQSKASRQMADSQKCAERPLPRTSEDSEISRHHGTLKNKGPVPKVPGARVVYGGIYLGMSRLLRSPKCLKPNTFQRWPGRIPAPFV